MTQEGGQQKKNVIVNLSAFCFFCIKIITKIITLGGERESEIDEASEPTN